MSRYIFKQGDQYKFMKAVKAKLGCPWEEISLKVGVSGRTLRDWQREILLGNKEILSKLSRLSGVSLPPVIGEREEWWNTRAWSKRASKIRMKMYGPPGTPEGRSKGICIGSKMKANIGIPEWIKSNPIYSKSCIRGLIDTDGCFFIHKYKVNNKMYEYKKINFVSYIPQLMSDVGKQFKLLGFTPRVRGVRLFLYNQQEALRYLTEIGTSNPKNYFRWKLPESV